MVLPALLVVLALCLSGLSLAVDQVRCVDAARVAARAASRGEEPAQVREAALRLAPPESTVRLEHAGSDVVVHVTAPGPRLLPGLEGARARAVTPVEPGVRQGW